MEPRIVNPNKAGKDDVLDDFVRDLSQKVPTICGTPFKVKDPQMRQTTMNDHFVSSKSGNKSGLVRIPKKQEHPVRTLTSGPREPPLAPAPIMSPAGDSSVNLGRFVLI